MEFSHIGIITEERHEGEVFVPATRVWITDFTKHPYHIEWLRFEPDSPVTGKLRNEPHVCYRVPDIAAASAGMPVLMEPFSPLPGVMAGFYETDDGGVIEFIQYEGDLIQAATL